MFILYLFFAKKEVSGGIELDKRKPPNRLQTNQKRDPKRRCRENILVHPRMSSSRFLSTPPPLPQSGQKGLGEHSSRVCRNREAPPAESKEEKAGPERTSMAGRLGF